MYNTFEDKDSFNYWFMIASLTDIDITDNIKDYPRVITMQINGDEINPENALKRLKEECDHKVNEKAKELAEQMKYEILDPISEKLVDIENSIDKQFEEYIEKGKKND